MPERSQDVAILGGGIASLAAAYGLTTPALGGRYNVTVYLPGWRLGGKCASGRNQVQRNRIEEHGLHIWFGFYDNAFALMRDCYGTWNPPTGYPLATWDQAFSPCDDVVLYERVDDRWCGWRFGMPRNDLPPGTPERLPTFWEITQTALYWLVQQWSHLRMAHPLLQGLPIPPSVPAHLHQTVSRLSPQLQQAWSVVPPMVRRMVSSAVSASQLLLVHPEHLLAEATKLAGGRAGWVVDEALESHHRQQLCEHLLRFKSWLWQEIVQPQLDDDELRLFFTMCDVLTAVISGIVNDGLVERGFGAVNDKELRQWLLDNGAQPFTVAESPLLRGMYAVAFAYLGGNSARPSLAAGTAVQGLLRLIFTYRGSFMWKMQAGMGDTVFTPLYEVLRSRGVQFRFFHAVTGLELSPDRRSIETVRLRRQVVLKDPEAEYEPLVAVRDLRCWPSQPKWDLISDDNLTREVREKSLSALEAGRYSSCAEEVVLRRRGADGEVDELFDTVVLGIPVGALGPLCSQLVENTTSPRFREMLEHSPTVMTQAFQVWLNRSPEELGWQFADNSATTAFVDPLNTYANMSHLLQREDWSSHDRVEAIAYFCGALSDQPGDTEDLATQRARNSAIAYLEGEISELWPHASPGQGIDWDVLVAPEELKGRQRFDAQFFRANCSGTERYSLTPPGNPRYRLRAEESGYDNLILAGDWTKTGLDAGCVEAAVMSGMQASRAICGQPQVIHGESDDWLGRSLP